MLLPTCLPPASMFLKPLALFCNAARPVPAHFIKPQYGFAFSGSEETLMCLFRWCTQTQKQVVESKNNFAQLSTSVLRDTGHYSLSIGKDEEKKKP